MTTDIWRQFDPNLEIPVGLKNAKEIVRPDIDHEYPEPNATISDQDDSLGDDESELDEDENDEELGVPSYFTVISQSVRTATDGRTVIDVVIDVEEIAGAINYEVRIAV